MLFVWVGQECRGIDIQCITTAGLLLHCEGDPVDSLQVLSSQLYARLKQECYYHSVPLLRPLHFVHYIQPKVEGGLYLNMQLLSSISPPRFYVSATYT